MIELAGEWCEEPCDANDEVRDSRGCDGADPDCVCCCCEAWLNPPYAASWKAEAAELPFTGLRWRNGLVDSWVNENVRG